MLTAVSQLGNFSNHYLPPVFQVCPVAIPPRKVTSVCLGAGKQRFGAMLKRAHVHVSDQPIMQPLIFFKTELLITWIFLKAELLISMKIKKELLRIFKKRISNTKNTIELF